MTLQRKTLKVIGYKMIGPIFVDDVNRAQFFRSIKVSISNAFAYFSILVLA